MTERFRYPPKGYPKAVSSGIVEGEDDDPTQGACRLDTTSKPTLTSSVSQKIHMDRIQNGSDQSRRKLGDGTYQRSGRMTGTL